MPRSALRQKLQPHQWPPRLFLGTPTLPHGTKCQLLFVVPSILQCPCYQNQYRVGKLLHITKFVCQLAMQPLDHSVCVVTLRQCCFASLRLVSYHS